MDNCATPYVNFAVVKTKRPRRSCCSLISVRAPRRGRNCELLCFVLFATALEKNICRHSSRNSAEMMVRGSSQEAFRLCWSWVPSFSSPLRFSRPERHQHGIACGPGKHSPVTSDAKECERAGRRNRHRPGLSLSALLQDERRDALLVLAAPTSAPC